MRLGLTFLAAAITFSCLDLLWLGVVMGDFYNAQMGTLKANPVLVGPAVLFYLFYLGFVVWFAVLGASSPRESWRRGAGMGLFAYGTYELTNWAVIQNWPAGLVVVDMAWGVVLTGSVAWIARRAFERLGALSVSTQP
jgi:uncharacterized membrane protein